MFVFPHESSRLTPRFTGNRSLETGEETRRPLLVIGLHDRISGVLGVMRCLRQAYDAT